MMYKTIIPVFLATSTVSAAALRARHAEDTKLSNTNANIVYVTITKTLTATQLPPSSTKHTVLVTVTDYTTVTPPVSTHPSQHVSHSSPVPAPPFSESHLSYGPSSVPKSSCSSTVVAPRPSMIPRPFHETFFSVGTPSIKPTPSSSKSVLVPSAPLRPTPVPSLSHYSVLVPSAPLRPTPVPSHSSAPAKASSSSTPHIIVTPVTPTSSPTGHIVVTPGKPNYTGAGNKPGSGLGGFVFPSAAPEMGSDQVYKAKAAVIDDMRLFTSIPFDAPVATVPFDTPLPAATHPSKKVTSSAPTSTDAAKKVFTNNKASSTHAATPSPHSSGNALESLFSMLPHPRSSSSSHSPSKPSAAPAPSKHSSAPAPGKTVVMGNGPHCPYPYPGEHCGGGSFTTVVSEKATPTPTPTPTPIKQDKKKPEAEATGWCPYPGQKC
jgi:hypothetical protein